MEKKKGFIAISLIYSFFLVFLILMVSILTKSVNNRILVGAIQDEIRTEIDGQSSFIVDVLERKTYTVGETVSFANETWNVIQNKTNSVVLILNRGLSKAEVELNLGRSATDAEYYGSCNDSGCQVKACRSAASGEQYCYLYRANTNLYRIPAWAPTITQIRDQNYGQTIVSAVTNSWYRTHQGLQKVSAKGKLVNMTFNDGSISSTGYIRLPLSSELSQAATWKGTVTPFHILNRANNTNTYIYNTALQSVYSDTAAYIRPVIEAIKG